MRISIQLQPWRPRDGEHWDSQAECRPSLGAHDPGLWTSDNSKERGQAKEICFDDCPVRLECLEAAVQETKAYGIRGGYYFVNGAPMPSQVETIIEDLIDHNREVPKRLATRSKRPSRSKYK